MSNHAVETSFTTGIADAAVAGSPAASNLAVFPPNLVTQAVPTISTGVVTDTNPTGRYTEEDLARVREQEKSKLYPQIDTLKAENERFRKAEEAREADAARLATEAAEADRKRIEADTDTRTLLLQKEAEWEARFADEKAAREQANVLLERERNYQALQSYRVQRMSEEQDNIMPELLDLVTGSSEEEIESSIAGLRDRSSRIFESAASAFQQNRQNLAGSRVTSPAAGPLDTDSSHKTFTAEEIAAMPFAEYVKHRSALLGQAAKQRNQGMFG